MRKECLYTYDLQVNHSRCATSDPQFTLNRIDLGDKVLILLELNRRIDGTVIRVFSHSRAFLGASLDDQLECRIV